MIFGKDSIWSRMQASCSRDRNRCPSSGPISAFAQFPEFGKSSRTFGRSERLFQDAWFIFSRKNRRSSGDQKFSTTSTGLLWNENAGKSAAPIVDWATFMFYHGPKDRTYSPSAPIYYSLAHFTKKEGAATFRGNPFVLHIG